MRDILQFRFLDGLRGLAALMVLIGHAKWLLHEGYTEGFTIHQEHYSLFDTITFYFFRLFRFGHEAVMFFFVLSGFVIHLGSSKKLAYSSSVSKFDFDFKRFYRNRIRRIFPPFLLALTLTWLIDSVGLAMQLSVYTHTTPYSTINKAATFFLDLPTLVGNLMMIIEPTFQNFGSNSVTWSLKYEWWFYVSYPLLLLINRKSIVWCYGLVVVLWVLSFYHSIWPIQMLQQICSLLVCWWSGALLADVYCARARISMCQMVSCIIAIVPALFVTNPLIYDFFISLFFMGLLALLLSVKKNNVVIRFIERFDVVGHFSYTLYLVHFPIFLFASAYIINRFGGLPIHSGFVVLGVVVALGVSYLLALLVERPFMKSAK